MNQNLKERLSDLVYSLSSAEKNILHCFLNATKNSWQDQNTLLKLLQAVEENTPLKETGDQGKKQRDASRKNLENLEDRILDSLLMDVNLDRGGRYKAGNQFSLVLLKDQMKAAVLSQRGCQQKAFEKLHRTSERHIAIQDYDSAIACLQLQLNAVSLHTDPLGFKSKKDLLFTLKRHQMLRDRSVDLFLELRMKKYFNILENLDAFIEDSLAILIRSTVESDSKVLAYVLLYFEKEWAEIQKDHFMALNCIEKMHLMLEETFFFPQVQSPYELIYEQARILLEIDCAEIAKDFLYHAKRKLSLENEYGQAVLELLFTLELSQGRLTQAETLLEEIYGSSFFEKCMPTQNRFKWEYFKAILHFRNGRQKKFTAHIRLHMSSSVFISLEEKVRLKIMEVLCAIDAQMLDYADRTQEALRKFIARNKVKEHTTAQHLFELMEVLWQLKYCGYDLTRLNERQIDLQAFLTTLESVYLELPLNKSLIRWDLWFAKRLKQTVDAAPLYHRVLTERRENYFKTGTLSKLFA